jgi:membrane protease YdiL (CAAX protease family)
MAPKSNRRTSSTKKAQGPTSDYWSISKDLFHSFLLVLPLFVVYQIGVLSTGGAVNGVDFTTRTLFALTRGDIRLYIGFQVFVLAGLLFVLKMLPNKKRLHAGIWAWVIVESAVYAFFLSGVITSILTGIFHISPPLVVGPSAGSKIILSIGAGFFEELVFRLILLSSLVALLQSMHVPRGLSAIVGVLVSSFIFSAAHYIGPTGEALVLYSFLFRFMAGILFAGLFWTRGFAVAVYTHAIYDIFVMVVFA